MDQQAVANLNMMREHEQKMHTPITDRLARVETKLTIILAVMVPVAAGVIAQSIYWLVSITQGA